MLSMLSNVFFSEKLFFLICKVQVVGGRKTKGKKNKPCSTGWFTTHCHTQGWGELKPKARNCISVLHGFESSSAACWMNISEMLHRNWRQDLIPGTLLWDVRIGNNGLACWASTPTLSHVSVFVITASAWKRFFFFRAGAVVLQVKPLPVLEASQLQTWPLRRWPSSYWSTWEGSRRWSNCLSLHPPCGRPRGSRLLASDKAVALTN